VSIQIEKALLTTQIENVMTRLSVSFRICICLFVVALNALVIFVIIPAVNKRIDPTYNVDQFVDPYDQLASNLISGNGYRLHADTAPTVSREPGYPLFLAGIYSVFGTDFTAVKLANMFLAFGVAWLMTRISGRISKNPVLVFGAPMLFLFHPGTLIAESRGGVEMLFTFCLMLFLFIACIALETGRWTDYLISGAALGLAVLVKSTPLLFPLFLLVYLVIFKRNISKAGISRNVAMMVCGMLVVLSPWIIRNYILTEKVILTASVMGISAHAGLYDNTHLSSGSDWARIDTDGARERRRLALQLGLPFKDIKNAYYQDFYYTSDELEFSNVLLKSVMSEYERRPTLFIRNVCFNFFNLWFRGKTWKSTGMNLLVQLPYLILAVIGMALCVKNGEVKVSGLSALLLLYMVVVYVQILAQARYSVPLIPIVSFFACITLVSIRGMLRATSEGEPEAFAVVMASPSDTYR
jgi:4-amino-4-deoxy-L-arabinose transferase-like glycosyltransferase